MKQENYQERVRALAEELHLPEPIKRIVTDICARLPWEMLHENVIELTDPRHAENAREEVLKKLQGYQDEGNMAELAVMLAAASHTRERYRAMKISDQIYLDTMGCFARFLEETKRNRGEWKFDRGFWTWRQTSCLLFRLGALEFEYTHCFWDGIWEVSRGDRIISVHIPSDAKLTKENLGHTYDEMKEFYGRKGSDICYAGNPKAVVCHTWLLSPTLLKFLGEDSNIRRFAADYEILETDTDNGGCLEWLFEGKTDLNTLPEHTGLQKEVKQYLLQGGVIGQGLGRLKNQTKNTC